ncbi:DUF6973 domain-containing protein [Clostridium sardiniense]|uniref:DUF6973 domain-containing protein n=1 Tax=Clostridium sardiniense TaxID=29369 RepID=UPI00195BF47E|nr:hypothetical protein [Clostridium sardiniense]MBM7836681.1 hypothetical protein [Clostridium sardiniense]
MNNKKISSFISSGILAMSIINQPILAKANEITNDYKPTIEKSNQSKEYYQNIIENRGKILTTTDFDKINNILIQKEKNNVKLSDTEILKLIVKAIKEKETKPQARKYNIFNQKVTRLELSLTGAYPREALLVFSNSKKANKAAQSRYVSKPSSVLYKGNGDAFRHAYWNVLNRRSVGESFAKLFSDAHESEEPNGIDKTMDLRNNKIGIDLGKYTNNPETVVKYVNNGWLWRIVNNKLTVTDSSGRK